MESLSHISRDIFRALAMLIVLGTALSLNAQKPTGNDIASIPAPTPTKIGGVKAKTCAAGYAIGEISTDGTVTCVVTGGGPGASVDLQTQVTNVGTVGKVPISDGTNLIPGDPWVQGTQADGSATEPNPVLIGGWDGAHLRAVLTDVAGRMAVNINGTVPVSNSALTSMQFDPSNYLKVVFQNSSLAVTGTFFQSIQPVSGTVSVNVISGFALETGGNLASIKTNTDKIPSLGQALAASSVPIVLTAAQLTTLTPLSSVTVTQGTGTNLHTVVDSGSVTAAATLAAETTKVIGTVNISSGQTVGLAAGSAVVGHVINDASSAVIGHVISDTGSTTAVTQSTGTNLHAVIDTGSTAAVTQATGTNLHAVIDTGSTTAVTQATGTNLHTVVDSAPTTAVTNAGLSNLDVALSTRLKPADTLTKVSTVDTITNPVTVIQGTGSNLHTVCDSGCGGAAADTTGSGVIGSLNAALQVAMAGQGSAAVTLPSGNNLVGTLLPESSSDGGTTWQATVIRSAASGNIWQNSVAVSSTNAAYNIQAPGGASHVRVRVNPYTSGTATALIRATVQPDAVPDPLVQGTQAAGSSTQPNPIVQGGWDGAAVRGFKTDNTGILQINMTNLPNGYVDLTSAQTVAGAKTFTTLQCKNFEGIRCVDSANSAGWSGSDVGAWINAAYADLPSTGGTVMIGLGSYTHTTAVVFGTANKEVSVQCVPGTMLNWTPASGTAFTLNWGNQNATPQNQEMTSFSGCTLIATSAANTGIGLELNGSAGVASLVVENNSIKGFGTSNISFSNSAAPSFLVTIQNNFIGGYTGTNPTNCFFVDTPAENNRIMSNTISDCSHGIAFGTHMTNGDYQITGNSFDSNLTDGISINSASGTGMRISIRDNHFEDNATGGCIALQMGGGTVDFDTATYIHDTAAACTTAFNITGGLFTYKDLTILTNGVITNGILCGTGTACLGLTAHTVGGSSSVTNWVAASGTGNVTEYSPGSIRLQVSGAVAATIAQNGASVLQFSDNGQAWSHDPTTGAFSSKVLLPTAAASGDIGSAALPFANLWLGTAATNNAKIAPDAMTAARTVRLPDAPASVVMPAFITSNVTNSSTSMANATGLAWPLVASRNYYLHCDLIYQSASTGGLKIAFTGPASPTQAEYCLDAGVSATADARACTAAANASFATVVGATAVTTATTNWNATLSGTIENGVNAGTLQLQFASVAAVATVLERGSACTLTAIN